MRSPVASRQLSPRCSLRARNLVPEWSLRGLEKSFGDEGTFRGLAASNRGQEKFLQGPQRWAGGIFGGGTMSASQHGVDVDVDAVRARYTRAIGAYRAAGEKLGANPAQVAPDSFGQGFAHQGARIAEALSRMDETTAAYLSTRARNWEQIVRLSGDVAHADTGNAASFAFGEAQL